MSNTPPIILFPLNGTTSEIELTRAQAREKMRQTRQTLRQYWESDGVKAVVTLLEISASAMLRDAISPGATLHDQGQAYGASRCVELLRAVMTSEETED